jgi:uncharacterized protein (DUF433 family)
MEKIIKQNLEVCGPLPAQNWTELADHVLQAFTAAYQHGIDLVKLMQVKEYRTYCGIKFGNDGKCNRKYSKIGKGHLILTIEGRTMYLGRLIYCLFNDLDYWQFTDRIRYVDGNYENCSLRNLQRVGKKITEPKQIPVWNIRSMYATGMTPDEIGRRIGISTAQVNRAVLGYERLTIEEVESVRKIVG